MLTFYSGEGDLSNPEIVLGNTAHIMLTFADMVKKTPKRWKRIVQARVSKKKVVIGRKRKKKHESKT